MAELDPDTALQRFNEGDRSPEVLAALNKAADEAFRFPSPPVSPQDREPWRLEPERPFPLALERLLPWVQEENRYRGYLMPERKRLQVRFNYDPKSDRGLFLTLAIEGDADHILRFSFESDKRVSPGDLVKALRCANDWNRRMRWPKAVLVQEYLEAEEGPDAPDAEARELRERTHSATLRLESDIPFKQGLHQTALEALLRALVSASWEFWSDVIHYGRWWNPAVESQATDRVYRIGQQRPVVVHLPILRDESDRLPATLDERLHELLERKQAMARDFLSPGPSEKALERELYDALDQDLARIGP